MVKMMAIFEIIQFKGKIIRPISIQLTVKRIKHSLRWMVIELEGYREEERMVGGEAGCKGRRGMGEEERGVARRGVMLNYGNPRN